MFKDPAIFVNYSYSIEVGIVSRHHHDHHSFSLPITLSRALILRTFSILPVGHRIRYPDIPSTDHSALRFLCIVKCCSVLQASWSKSAKFTFILVRRCALRTVHPCYTSALKTLESQKWLVALVLRIGIRPLSPIPQYKTRLQRFTQVRLEKYKTYLRIIACAH